MFIDVSTLSGVKTRASVNALPWYYAQHSATASRGKKIRHTSITKVCLCTDSPTFEELCESADEQLFDKIKLNSNHFLNALVLYYRRHL